MYRYVADAAEQEVQLSDTFRQVKQDDAHV